MAFLRYAGKHYKNESREEQFLRYFRSTGTALALQRAMTLLYQMPVKPSNLEEYFAEYFENGAQDLVTLSLLRAEYCYKHAETQDMHKRIQSLESQIQSLEAQGFGKQRPSKDAGLSQAQSQGFALPFDLPSEPFSSAAKLPLEEGGGILLLNQFLGDVEGKATRAYSRGQASITESGGSSGPFLDFEGEADYPEEVEGEQEFLEEHDLEEYIEMNSLEEELALEEKLLLKEKHSLENWDSDLNKLDPWGIVCNRKIKKRQDHLHVSDTVESVNIPQLQGQIQGQSQGQVPLTDRKSGQTEVQAEDELSAVSSSDKSSDKIYQNFDSDDETLAELYLGAAQDTAEEQQELLFKYQTSPSPTDQPPKKIESNVKLLSVVQVPRKMSEMMGWQKIPCTTQDELKSQQNLSKPTITVTGTESKSNLFPQPDWSQFDVEGGVDQCLKDVDFYRDITWQDDAMKTFPVNLTDESFLLEYDMARIANKFGAKEQDAGFLFEFFQNFDTAEKSDKDGVCGHCKKWKGGKSSLLREMADKGTTTSFFDLMDLCHCEDCTCIWEDSPAWRIPPTTPGKMTNWTKDYVEYAGEYPEEKGPTTAPSTVPSTPTRKSKAEDFLEGFDHQLYEAKSLCQCPDADTTPPPTPTYFQEECANYCSRSPAAQASSAVIAAVEEPRPFERRASVDPELSKAFRESGGYLTPGDDIMELVARKQRSIQAELNAKELLDQRAHRGSAILKGADGGTVAGAAVEGEEPKYVSDVFEVDLEKEIKKQFGIEKGGKKGKTNKKRFT